MKYYCFTGEDQDGNPVFLDEIFQRVRDFEDREGQKRSPFSAISDGRRHTVWTESPDAEKQFCIALLDRDLDFQELSIRPIPVEGEVITPETFGTPGHRR